jgi:hypothetical protein
MFNRPPTHEITDRPPPSQQGDSLLITSPASTCYPQVRRNPRTWQPAAQPYPHSFLLELFITLDHVVGLLVRVLNAQVTGAKPLQV